MRLNIKARVDKPGLKFLFLVEMRRIELLSENIVTRLSPSAFGEKFQFQKLTEKFFETNHLKLSETV